MSIPQAVRDILEADPGVYGRPMLYAWPKDRNTDLPYGIGFWSGADHEDITVDGDVRTYYGAHRSLQIPNGIAYRSGTTIQMQEVQLGHLTPEAQAFLRVLDPNQAECQIHTRVYRSDTRQPVGLIRLFNGRIDQLRIGTGGGWGNVQGVAYLTLAPSSRDGTRTMTETRSDQVYRENAGDRIGRHLTAHGTRTTWGTDESN